MYVANYVAILTGENDEYRLTIATYCVKVNVEYQRLLTTIHKSQQYILHIHDINPKICNV